MKILTTEQIREADAYTIENEPIESIDLMERAAKQIFDWIYRRVSRESIIKIFCGMGNNGGDGLALARMLANQDIVPQVFIVRYSDTFSSDCEANLYRLENETRVPIFDILTENDFPKINENDLVVDAIFGTGINRVLQGISEELVSYINANQCIKIAIDIPSGLMADKPSDLGSVIFKADYTLTFQFPKLSFLFPEYETYVGHWEIMNIHLHKDFVNEVQTNNFLVNSNTIKPILHARGKFSHKGSFGHALLIAGSSNMTGAAILSGKACMRSGVGLLSVHVPEKAVIPIQTTLPEAILDKDESESCFTSFGELGVYSAIGVGPGLGTSPETAQALKRLIQDVKAPMVIDADALNILSENKTWISFLPPKTILTPHPKEFERLVGKTSNSFERLEVQRSFAMKNNLVVIVKGAFTATMLPNGTCFFNSTGNPGMATAGSGDVLTGIILSLLAQHYSPEEAAVLGVYLHGLAGDLASENIGFESLLASDIINYMGKAFLHIRTK